MEGCHITLVRSMHGSHSSFTIVSNLHTIFTLPLRDLMRTCAVLVRNVEDSIRGPSILEPPHTHPADHKLEGFLL